MGRHEHERSTPGTENGEATRHSGGVRALLQVMCVSKQPVQGADDPARGIGVKTLVGPR